MSNGPRRTSGFLPGGLAARAAQRASGQLTDPRFGGLNVSMPYDRYSPVVLNNQATADELRKVGVIPFPSAAEAARQSAVARQRRQSDIMKAYGLGAPSKLPQADVAAPTSAGIADTVASYLPTAGTPEMAGLGAAGREILKYSGWQDQPYTLGQILGAGAEKGLEAMKARQDAMTAAAEKKAAAERQAALDELNRRNIESQITARFAEKKTSAKEAKEVNVIRNGVRGTIRKRFVGYGMPGADAAGEIEIQNSFVPEAEKKPVVSVSPGDKESVKYAYKRLEALGKGTDSAQELINDYDFIVSELEANPDLSTGPMQEAILPFKQLFAEFGLLGEDELDEVMTLETLKAKMAFIVPRMREEGSGSTSNFEMGVFKTASPTLSKRRDSNILLAASARQAAQHKLNLQSEREAFVLENERLPSAKELGEIMETKYGSVFKTPFGRKINQKTSDEVDSEFEKMYRQGLIQPGDVVYMGKYGGFTYINNDFLQAAGLI